jgi:hypothetical protein
VTKPAVTSRKANELAQKILTILPDTADVCRDNRAFLQRAVRFLAGEAGVRQFLDIGTGLPTMIYGGVGLRP